MHEGEVHAVAFSPNSQMVLTGSVDKTARLWDAANGQPIGKPLGHRDAVKAVAFSPDSKTILTGSWDKTAQLSDVTFGQPLGRLVDLQGQMVGRGYNGHKYVFIPYDAETLWLWNAATLRPLGWLVYPLVQQLVTFSPDGKLILTFTIDGEGCLWEAATSQFIGPILELNAGITAAAFSPDSKTILTGSDDMTARLWDIASRRTLGSVLTHGGPVKAVAFDPDGKTALTWSEDKAARLWDAATGRPLGLPTPIRGDVTAIALNPDGKTVLTRNLDQTANYGIWPAAGRSANP